MVETTGRQDVEPSVIRKAFKEVNLSYLRRPVTRKRHPPTVNISLRQSIGKNGKNQRNEHLNDTSFRNDSWDIYGSPMADYQRDLDFCSQNINLVSFVKRRVSPVVIDLMSPSDALEDLFGQIEKENGLGIAVSLHDKRDNIRQEKDESLNIHQISGDLISSSTWGKLRKTLNGRKADLIMERGKGGLAFIPWDEKFSAIILNRIYRSLSIHGGMFIGQLGVRFDNIDNWLNYARENDLDVSYMQPKDEFKSSKSSFIKLIRYEDSPKDLRFLFRHPLWTWE